VVDVEGKGTPSRFLESVVQGTSEKGNDIEDNALEFNLDVESPRSNKRLQVGFVGTNTLKKQYLNEQNVPSTGIKGLQEVERAVSSKEVLISLSVVGIEKDGCLFRQISTVQIKGGRDQTNMVNDPYDMRESPPREKEHIVSLDNEPGDRRKSLSSTPSVNEAEVVEVPRGERPFI
jgi:hypothetical protein